MIPMFSKQASQAFDLTSSLKNKQHDPCWHLYVEPASFDIVGWVNAVTARGDIRRRFARIITGGRK